MARLLTSYLESGRSLDLDLGKDIYDVAIMYGILHCLESAIEIQRVISAVKESTKPGGINLLCTFNDRHQDLKAHPGFKANPVTPYILSGELCRLECSIRQRQGSSRKPPTQQYSPRTLYDQVSGNQAVTYEVTSTSRVARKAYREGRVIPFVGTNMPHLFGGGPTAPKFMAQHGGNLLIRLRS